MFKPRTSCSLLSLQARHSLLFPGFTLAILLCLPIAVCLTALTPWDSRSATAEEKIDFTILHTNDEHSALIPHSPAVDHHPEHPEDPTKGGFARLAAAIEDIRGSKEAREEPVLLFNAGDFLGGTAFGWLPPEGYSPEISLLQEMGYQAAVIGNHEYDYGPELLGNYLLDAGYPDAHQDTVMLASNTLPPRDYLLSQEGLYREKALFDLDSGLSVGVFGLIGEDAVQVAADTGDIEFADPVATAKEMVKELDQEGADVIVAITHSGVAEDRELASRVPGLDVIVGGHSHTALHEPIQEKDTIIVQADSLAKYLGYLELSYYPDTGELEARNRDTGRDFLVPIDNSFHPHPEIEQSVEEYRQKLNQLIEEMTQGEVKDILDP